MPASPPSSVRPQAVETPDAGTPSLAPPRHAPDVTCVVVGRIPEAGMPGDGPWVTVAGGTSDTPAARREIAERTPGDVLAFVDAVRVAPRHPDLAQLHAAVTSRSRSSSAQVPAVVAGSASEARRLGHPVASVIVPVCNGESHLDAVLQALVASDISRNDWELIVVDDASRDASPGIAAGYADVLIRLTGTPRGPAYARNRGAEVARAPYLVFMDADVLVPPTALSGLVRALEQATDAVAVTGAYAPLVASRTIASKYRTLLDHVQHAAYAGDVDSFFGAFGIVRRNAFLKAGMYDEWQFHRPQCEDIELGHRLRDGGGRILLDATQTVTHGKHWTIPLLLADEFFERTIPGARALGRRWNVFRAPSMTAAKRQYGVLVALATGLVFVGLQFALGGWYWLGAAGAWAVAIIRDAPLFRACLRQYGPIFVMQAAPLHLLLTIVNGLGYAIGRMQESFFGDARPPALVEAWAEVGLESWPPMPRKPAPVPFPHA